MTVGMRGQTESATPATVPPAASATPPAAVPDASATPQAATTEAAAAPRGNQVQSAAQVATLRAFSNLVVIDVVVTDSSKNPVHGLKAADFTLMENGKPQTIRHFEEHKLGPAVNQVALAPKLPAGLFSNISPAPTNGPVNVLLLDYLNTPLTVQPQARKQLLDYLDKAPAGTRIAIFGMTTHLYMLQGFTSDMAVLKAALGAKKGLPQVSDILTDPVNGGPMGTTAFEDAASQYTDATQEMLDDQARADAQITSEEQNNRMLYTLNSFDQLARYLVGIPGRKNVIWYSASFPMDVEPNVNEADPNDSVIRNDEAVRKMDNLLTRAQIAVYPVDARGLMTDSTYDISNSLGDAGTNQAGTMGFNNQTAQEHSTMDAMAEDTGGEAFYNTNGLTSAVGKAIEEGSNYYTLSYTPSNVQWDERFRTIKVKVDNPSAKNVSYRNGYYAIDPNDRNKLNASGAATALATPTTMLTAMMHGGPDAAQILFKVRIRPASTPPEEAVIQSNRTNPDPKVKVEGPFKEYGVDLVPDPNAVNCSLDANGNHHCALEIWSYVYDRDGKLLVTTGNRVFRMLTPADYKTLLSGGMAFHQEISVPVKGQYYLRTAIHDMVSDRVGTVEIPIAQVAKLEPLKELPAASDTSPAAPAAVPDAAAPAAATPAAAPAAPATP
ncbi:MAG TPA: VWA domain-containing protein [Acidobacteriaceae bacterium]|nr:VWA domain-containing protein [Acidobacteriaceae bacterium]